MEGLAEFAPWGFDAMIHDNPHHYLERNADEVGSFLERQLTLHRARVRRKLAVASGIIGVMAVAGLTALYMFDMIDPELPDGVKKANLMQEAQPKSASVLKDELNDRWAGEQHMELLRRLDELIDEVDEREDARSDIRKLLAGFPFADLRPDLLDELNSEIRQVIDAIMTSAATEHRSRVQEWFDSPHTNRSVKRKADRCLRALGAIREGGGGTAPTSD